MTIAFNPRDARRNERFSERDITAILTSHLNTNELAIEHNVTAWTIRQIITGIHYRDVAPHLPRCKPQDRKRTCWNCIHCTGRTKTTKGERPSGCAIDIPEQSLMGASGARYCNWHQPAGMEPAFVREAA